MVDLDYNKKNEGFQGKQHSIYLNSMFQVCCGNWHYMALMESGQVYSWGYNDHGQLGLGSKMESQVCNSAVHSNPTSISFVLLSNLKSNSLLIMQQQSHYKIVKQVCIIIIMIVTLFLDGSQTTPQAL